MTREVGGAVGAALGTKFRRFRRLRSAGPRCGTRCFDRTSEATCVRVGTRHEPVGTEVFVGDAAVKDGRPRPVTSKRRPCVSWHVRGDRASAGNRRRGKCPSSGLRSQQLRRGRMLATSTPCALGRTQTSRRTRGCPDSPPPSWQDAPVRRSGPCRSRSRCRAAEDDRRRPDESPFRRTSCLPCDIISGSSSVRPKICSALRQ
jgi:hypothetical protein